MEPWTVEHRVFAFECFVQNNESVTAVQREFRCHFNIHQNRAVPSRNTILRWIESLCRRGELINRRPRGAPRTVRTPENVELVRQAFLHSPTRSARKYAAALRLSDRSVRRILHMDLRFHPYKLAIVQQLQPGDYAQGMNFARQMEALIDQNENLILFMSDEAHFHLNSMVNQQNCHYWANENPQQFHERPLHSPKVTVWCAVSQTCIIGPYFFEDGNGRAVTVN
ncbi:hypothetical protein C0J52_14825 [Blattella germanica]|nr:hypothetical protein C0J52_14825 [Blattella germanica]